MNGQQNTRLMNESFAAYAGIIKTLETHLSQARMPPHIRGEWEDSLFCLKLFITLYEEANRAVQAEAWFAASSVSAAALEALLMTRCLLSADKVKSLPKWQSLQKQHKGDFRAFVRLMDLGKLIEVGENLSWFPPANTLPKRFLEALSPHGDPSVLQGIKTLFEGTQNIGHLCATHVRQQRNLLHPAVCLKEGVQPSAETGLVATMMFLIAITALQESVRI